MGTAENYTKKKISDITIFNDDIDTEYHKRVMAIRTKQDLKDLLEDYEEFLPEGLQEFRQCDDLAFRKLRNQINRFFQIVKNRGTPPSEPTEAIMFITPPMITMPRGIAKTRSAEEKRPVTWGEAFVDMANIGMISQLMEAQENMYKKVIEIRPIVEEMLDTDSI